MRQRVSRAYRATAAIGGSDEAPRLVVAAGVVMILAQLGFRAWALFPSWFYLDDYKMLRDAQDHRGIGDLFTPYNGHLMPGGRLLVLAVESSGQLNWGLACTLTIALQAVASGAALWMLMTLFGVRWGILGPLALYLFSPVTLPALMWWTACLTQITIQAGLFLAVGAWVLHLRGGGRRWILATLGGVAFGLAFDVKGLLIFLVLAFIALSYFASGGLVARIRFVTARYWPATLVGTVAVLAYVAYYVTHVSQPFETPSLSLVGGLAATMLGSAFLTGAVGGPWHWSALAPPNAFADPPATAVHATWVVIALVVAYSLLRRRRALRAWLLLAGYLVVLLALLVSSRGLEYGALIGLEYRYLTDATCILALAIGLAFMPLLGAVESSEPRSDLLRLEARGPVVATATALVVTSSLVSSALYVDIWHTQNASDGYVHLLAAEMRTYGAVDLSDQALPDAVIPGIFAPDNSLSNLVPLVSDRASFPDTTSQLMVVAPDGGLRQALIKPGVLSRPGPRADCGWRVTASGLDIPLDGRAFEWRWWVRIGYLSSRSSPVRITAGDAQVDTQVESGVRSLYARVSGTFDSIRVDGLDPGTTLCIDTIEVGQPVPGGTS